MARKKVGKKSARAHKKKASRSAGRHKMIVVSPGKAGAHVFDTFHVLVLESEIRARGKREEEFDSRVSRDLLDILNKKKHQNEWLVDFCFESLFRIVYGDRDPLETSTTKGSGGRLNVGFAQLTPAFPELEAMDGLYFSSDRETAWAEFNTTGLPPGPQDRLHEFHLNGRGESPLIDLDKVMAWMLADQTLVSHVASLSDVPVHGAWKYQKYPKRSQILGFWLWQSFSDNPSIQGIVFRSTKNPSGCNVILFRPRDFLSLS